MSTDKFKNRLKYYMIGLGLGCVASYFFFGNRSCEWLPGNRVKNMIAEKEIFVGDSISDLMKCHGVNESDVYRLLNDEGDVEFGESKTEGHPKEYRLSGLKEREDIWIRYALYDSTAEVIDFEFDSGNDCEITVSNRNKSVVPLPFSNVVQIIESHKFRLLSVAECQIECYDISKDDIFNFHNGAKVYVETSKPRLTPNPYYVLRGFLGDQELSVKYEIGENRTRIENIVLHGQEKECGCLGIE